MAKDFVAGHLCHFYNKHLNHCQLLQTEQFFSEFYQFFGQNEAEYGVTFYLTNEFLKEQRMKHVWF